jgi:hypothetical protein
MGYEYLLSLLVVIKGEVSESGAERERLTSSLLASAN